MASVAVATFGLICVSIRVLRVSWGWLRGAMRGGAARTADDEPRRREAATSAAGRRSTSSSSRVAAARPQPMTSVRHGGQRGLDVRGELGVVVAGDGQLAGYVDAAPGGDGRGRRSPSGRWRRRSRSAARPGPAARGWRRPRPRRRSRPRRTGPRAGPPRAGRRPRPSRRERPCTISAGPATCAIRVCPRATRCSTAAAIPGPSSTPTAGPVAPPAGPGPTITAGRPSSASSAGRGSST